MTSLAPRAKAVMISASDKSMAVVMAPAADRIVRPMGWALSMSKLSIKRSWAGSATPAPSARVIEVKPAPPVAVVMVKILVASAAAPKPNRAN